MPPGSQVSGFLLCKKPSAMKSEIKVMASKHAAFAETVISVDDVGGGHEPRVGRMYISSPYISAFIRGIAAEQLRELSAICLRVADECDYENEKTKK